MARRKRAEGGLGKRHQPQPQHGEAKHPQPSPMALGSGRSCGLEKFRTTSAEGTPRADRSGDCFERCGGRDITQGCVTSEPRPTSRPYRERSASSRSGWNPSERRLPWRLSRREVRESRLGSPLIKRGEDSGQGSDQLICRRACTLARAFCGLQPWRNCSDSRRRLTMFRDMASCWLNQDCSCSGRRLRPAASISAV